MIDVSIRLRRDASFSLDIAWQASKHERVVGIHGPSGAGKTTLLHVIAGLQRPDAGRVAIGDTILFDDAKGIDVPTHRRRVAMVFQEHRLFPHMTVERNLRYAAGASGDRMRAIVDVLELGPLLPRLPSRLSGGEAQRIAIGRAMLSSPRVLLLDEPFAAIDQDRRDQIMPFLRRLVEASDIPVLCVSHDLPDLLRLTDRLLLVDAGRCVGFGTPSTLLHQAAARRLLKRHGLVSIVDGVVEADATSTFIRAGDARMVAAVEGLEPGKRVRTIIKASDVALSSRPLEVSSIQNQWKARVVRVAKGDGSVLVELDAGFGLIAEVSPAAATELALEEGVAMWCLVTASAIVCGV